MTIKRRILIANLCMVGIPVAATLAALAICAAILWSALSFGQGFDDSADFREAALAATAAADRALGAGGDERAQRFDELDRLLDKMHLAIEVTDAEGATVHRHGAALAPALSRAAAALSDGGMVEQDGRAVAIAVLDVGGAPHRLAIGGTMNTQASYAQLKAIALACAAAVIVCVLISSILAGRFARRFLVRRIEAQLDELAGGLRALADGDLAHRITWAPDAEFALACDDFNLMAERQQRAVERLERQDAVRRQLIADIAHDLRSPLTSVKGYAEALRDGAVRAPEKRRRYLGVICEKADQMDGLVENLFEFSKLEVADYPVRIEALDAAALLRDIAASAERSHPGGLRVEVRALPVGDAAWVLADRALFRRVTENLLDNSVKYRVGETACVAISVEVAGGGDGTGAPPAAGAGFVGTRLITFADDGIGVDGPDLERIFDPFFRGDAAREHPERGSGMGLAFVRRAVELMGGSVRARANAPHGLVVEIELPGAEPGAADGAGTVTDGGALPHASPAPSTRRGNDRWRAS